MKKISYNLLLFLLAIPSLVLADTGNKNKYTKEKKIEKTYLVNSDVLLNINNTFGNIYVSVWDENKTAIKITIKVSGNKEDAVNKKIDAIDIQMEAYKSNVTAKTIISKGLKNENPNLNIEINYTIKIPKNGSVKLENKYGGITVDKLIGKADIICRYGQLSVNELQNENNTILMEYSTNSVIGYLKGGIINAKYSDFILDKSDKLDLKSDYTQLKIKNNKDLIYKSTYGKISIDNADQINGSGNYLTLNFGKISKQVDIVTNYSQIKIGEITAKAKNVNITSGYTGIIIGYNENYPFNFDFNMSYSSLNKNSDLEIQSKNEIRNQTTYKGYYKKSGINTINIVSRYGNLKLIKN